MPKKAKPVSTAAADKPSGSSKVARAPRSKKDNVNIQPIDVVWNREMDQMIISKLGKAGRHLFRQVSRSARHAVNAYVSRVSSSDTSVINHVASLMYPNLKQVTFTRAATPPTAVTNSERRQMDESFRKIATNLSGDLTSLSVQNYLNVSIVSLTAVSVWPALKSLALTGISMCLPPRDIKSLGRLDMPSLTFLDLSGNRTEVLIQNEIFKLISTLLATSVMPPYILFADNRLGAAGVTALAKAAWLSQLTRLELSKNSLGDDGMRDVALLSVPALCSLNLDDNGLTHMGTFNLSRATNMGSLMTLSLEDNAGISDRDDVWLLELKWPGAFVRYSPSDGRCLVCCRNCVPCCVCGNYGSDDSGWFSG